MTGAVLAAPAPSGLSWAGDIPAHWSVAPLRTRYSVQLGKMLDEKRFVGTHAAPYLRNADVQWAGINTDGLPVMDFAPADRRKYELRAGDVLVCEGGEVGRAAVWSGAVSDCFYQKALHRVRAIGQDDPRFLCYLLFAAARRGAFTDGNVSTISHLPAEKLRAHRFPFPPPDEQRAIARVLDARTASIDALLAVRRRQAELLDATRLAIIDAAVSGASAASRAGAPRGGWVPTIPEHWTVSRLKFVAEVRGGVTKGRDLSGVETVSLPYLRVANVQDGYLDLSDVAEIEVGVAEIERYRLRRGDVLMNEGGDNDKLGRGAVWDGAIDPCLHQNHVFAVRPRRLADGEWLAVITQSSYAKRYFEAMAKQSTNLASISGTNLSNLPIVLPPVAERDRTVAVVRERLATVDALRSELDKSLALLLEYRAALVVSYVTGQSV